MKSRFITLFGCIIGIIAFFTPTGYFENIVWNHQITIWIYGFFTDKYNNTITSGYYSNSLQYLPSIICSLIILVSFLIITLNSILLRIEIKKISAINFLLAIIIMISIIIWIIRMEIAEQEIWGFSMWNRYTMGFGIYGLILGSSIILFRSLFMGVIAQQ